MGTQGAYLANRRSTNLAWCSFQAITRVNQWKEPKFYTPAHQAFALGVNKWERPKIYGRDGNP